MANFEIWQRDVAAGLYEWEGPVALSARYSVAGQKHLAFLQLARRSKGVDMHLIDRLFKDPAALERLRLAQQQVASPNEERPAEAETAGQSPPGPSTEPEAAPAA
jgi:hypothetical protein